MASRWIAGLALACVYLASRLAHLTSLPVFIDEALHIQRARQTLEGQIGAGLEQGKWLIVKAIALFSFLPLDALTSARLVAVVAGLATLVAVILIGKELFSDREGYLAGLLYVVLPFAVLYARMALADGLVVAFGAWSLLFSIRVTAEKGWRSSGLLALTLVGAILSKLSGALFITFPALAVLVLAESPHRKRALLRITPAIAATLGVLGIMLWQGAGVQEIEGKTGIPAFAELAALFLGNAGLLVDWLWGLLTPALAILSLVAVVWAGFHFRNRRILFVLAVLLVCVAPYVLFARIWFARYVLFVTVPLAVLMAAFLVALYDRASRAQPAQQSTAWRAVLIAGIACLLAWPIAMSATLIARPEAAALPEKERWQYVEGSPAGYNLPEAASELMRLAAAHASEGGINVVRFGFWNAPYQGLDVYLPASDAIHVYTVNAFDAQLHDELSQLARERPTYFVSSPSVESVQLRKANRTLEDYFTGAEQVAVFKKPFARHYLVLWRLNSEPLPTLPPSGSGAPWLVLGQWQATTQLRGSGAL